MNAIKHIALLLFVLLFVAGCGPDFSVDTAEEQIRKIMYRNSDEFSPGGQCFFSIKKITFQKTNQLSGEMEFVVKFEAASNRNKIWTCSRFVTVGKDDQGFYVEADNSIDDKNAATKRFR